MLRRHVIGACAALASLPLLAAQAAAQQAAETAIPEEKQPMLTLGTYSKLTSELALERATTEAVRTFAELEVAEQTAVAAAFGAADAPPIVTEAQSAMLEELRAVEDAGFEMGYVDGQIAAHEEGLGIASAYSESGTDPMAQGAAMVLVPAIESHLVMLRGIRATMA